MSALHAEQFAAFFSAVYGTRPFPWQQRLAIQVCAGHWPAVLALPTASGKTACLDIAVFALACQADWPVARRTAPRRVFFVVDRRVIVDEAYERAQHLASTLHDAQNGIVKEVADALHRVAGHNPNEIQRDGERPLACFQLRNRSRGSGVKE